MTEPLLTFEHFVKNYSVLGEYYNQEPSTDGMMLVYKALSNHCKYITNDMFSYAIEKAMLRCKFMPRVDDILHELLEKDPRGLPKAPDIDIRYADSYQQGIYHKWKNNHDKALMDASYSESTFRAERIKEIPNLLPLSQEKMLHTADGYKPYEPLPYKQDDVITLGNCRLCPSLTSNEKQQLYLEMDSIKAIGPSKT